ncbi:hypothetical protein LINPERHAP2_LOCUS39101, partial [Linum perenne]
CAYHHKLLKKTPLKLVCHAEPLLARSPTHVSLPHPSSLSLKHLISSLTIPTLLLSSKQFKQWRIVHSHTKSRSTLSTTSTLVAALSAVAAVMKADSKVVLISKEQVLQLPSRLDRRCRISWSRRRSACRMLLGTWDRRLRKLVRRFRGKLRKGNE